MRLEASAREAAVSTDLRAPCPLCNAMLRVRPELEPPWMSGFELVPVEDSDEETRQQLRTGEVSQALYNGGVESDPETYRAQRHEMMWCAACTRPLVPYHTSLPSDYEVVQWTRRIVDERLPDNSSLMNHALEVVE